MILKNIKKKRLNPAAAYRLKAQFGHLVTGDHRILAVRSQARYYLSNLRPAVRRTIAVRLNPAAAPHTHQSGAEAQNPLWLSPSLSRSGAMGGASKLLSSLLLTSSPLRLRPTTAAAALFLSPPYAASRRLLLLSSRSPPRTLSSSSAAASSSLPHGSSSASPAQPPRAHFPEWSRLVDRLAAAGYASRAPSPADELALSSGCGLSDGAETAVSTCLAFARDRPDLLR